MAQIILVTLPIGNLQDITQRALEALKSSGPFLAEDTRNLKKLFQLYDISIEGKTLLAYHDHDRSAIDKAMSFLKAGKDVYLVSDAGSPMISDPGYPLVMEALSCGFKMTTLPGASAVVSALELSGLPPHPFIFHGFSPRDDKKRERLFEECWEQTLAREQASLTHILYESPHRMDKTLKALAKSEKSYPDRVINVALARELTKKFETVYRFRALDYLDPESSLHEIIQIKGECVLVFHMSLTENAQRSVMASAEWKKVESMAKECLDSKGHPKNVSKLLAQILSIAPKEAYNLMKR